MPETTMTTERLLLRPFMQDDLAGLHAAIWSDPQVVRYLPGSRPRTHAETQKVLNVFVNCWQTPNTAAWAVIAPDSGRLIGECGISPLPNRPADCEIFYALAADCWGQGYATEIARACLRYGFATFDLPCIFACAVPENTASRRVMEKLNMRFDGLQPYSDRFEHDLAFYSITREQFDRVTNVR